MSGARWEQGANDIQDSELHRDPEKQGKDAEEAGPWHRGKGAGVC